MLSIKDAAPLLKPGGTGRQLQKRIISTTKTDAGRARWRALGIDPDAVQYGVGDEFTPQMAEVLGEPYPGDGLPPDPPKPDPPKQPKPKPPRSKAAKVKKGRSRAPVWLVNTQGALLPLAEGYSFGRIIGQTYPEYGLAGVVGAAFLGYVVGTVAWSNYQEIEDLKRAEVWAVLMALVQFLVHLCAAYNWAVGPAAASAAILLAGYAANAAKRRE
jgi:hypothetical protein